VPVKEVRAIHEAAQIITTGTSKMDFESLVLSMPRERADEVLSDKDSQFLFEIDIGLAVLGAEIPLGRLRGVLREISVSYADTDTPGTVEVVLEPTSEEAAHPTFELVRSDPSR
jgi:hypothetical protein